MTISGDLLLWNARLLDGSGGPPRERVTIEVRGGLIAAIKDGSGAHRAADSRIRGILGGRHDVSRPAFP